MTPKNVWNFPLSLQLPCEARAAHPYHIDIGSAPPPPRGVPPPPILANKKAMPF